MMASSSAATPDTLITLKVNFDGVTRKTKLPLRDLGVNTLEDKLRAFLQIPVGTKATIERYSDSATSYVLLQPTNISVYKQLYRAAKAKQKLKLRILTQAEPKPQPKPEPEETKAPKPVTVEDEPELTTVEPASRVPLVAPALSVPPSTQAPAGTVDTIVAPQAPEDFPEFIHEWRTRGMPRIHLRRDGAGVEVVDFVGAAISAEPLVTLEPVERPSNVDSTLPPADQYQFSQTASKMSLSNLVREAREHEEAVALVRKNEEAVAEPQASQSPEAVTGILEEEKEEATNDESSSINSCSKRPFTVCCNSCDRAVPDAHFHCSTCDDGDFDLCQDCVNAGVTCYGEDHWLIKRTIREGQINYSTTTHIAPKPAPPKPAKEIPTMELPIRSLERLSLAPTWSTAYNARTCNCCVQEFSDEEFVHCTTCDDFDLCKSCFAKDKHGHHPNHGFAPAVKGTVFEHAISSRLSPGRDIVHNAICDGCDKYVRGVRHKCLDCPDWDYCSECIQNAAFIHPTHRFVAVYEPLADRHFRPTYLSTHHGICCDGPLCAAPHGGSKYIVGVRYKCAVCDDTDFCANCEASPSNTHNKTHPLLKLKTPVRRVSVTTTGEHEDGQRLPTMGDRAKRTRMNSRSTETHPSPRESMAATPVQTVVDVEPTEQQSSKSVPIEVTEVKKEEVTEIKKEVIDLGVATPVEEKQPNPDDLVAIFKRDTVADGTVLPPNHTFEQTWVLRNEGTVPWPAGCSVKFVGGDYMGAVDPTHPAGIHELVSASESIVCYAPLSPGQEFPFTVLMRTPDREGNVISYWRLTTRDGVKFGHKLWCHVTVQAPVSKSAITTPQPEPEQIDAPAAAPEMVKSQMIIPVLEHESPSASLHEEGQTETAVETETDTFAPSTRDLEEDDFEDCGEESVEDDEWAESDDGFMTDEEYDILDASDEEYLSEQQKLASKK
ncbi:hypothetical protein F5B20DRAFT_536967 [Whalleya microplaca]|nr:hypothetical protein F5B20DRAFT_536967 [Whalleya microplaca]